MVARFLNWLKADKFRAFLFIFFVLFGALILKVTIFGVQGVTSQSLSVAEPAGDSYFGSAKLTNSPSLFRMENNIPPSQTSDRMVSYNSNLSLLVKNVSDTITKIKTSAEELGGYMITSSVREPTEGASGSISVRVPKEKLETALKAFKDLSVKVVVENLTGTDVTDQYKDNESRLTILLDNKARFEAIMLKATEIQDILRVQQEIFNLQSQIDQIKGEQQYLEGTSKFARIDINLSEDEYSLPYAPSESWRPDVIFKLAIRSVVTNLRRLGSLGIWVGVYSIFWVPALILFVLIKKYKARKNNPR